MFFAVFNFGTIHGDVNRELSARCCGA